MYKSLLVLTFTVQKYINLSLCNYYMKENYENAGEWIFTLREEVGGGGGEKP